MTASVPVAVADYLLNKKRREILDLEARRDVSIIICGNAQMVPGESQIDRKGQPAQ